MSEFANNESAFEALLESIKQASNNIKRDEGTRFETPGPTRNINKKIE